MPVVISTSKIALKTLIQQIQQIHNEGLKLCHYETKVKALKLSWIKRFTYEKTPNVRFYLNYFINARTLTPFLMLIINFYLTQIFLSST